jgi:hypothetical protein
MDKEITFNPTNGELFMEAKQNKKESYNKKNIFISHDARDTEIAKSFCNLLESSCSVIVKTFCSSRAGDIFYGSDWYYSIMDELNKCTDIVCLFTKHSKRKPWLLFEAGYAKSRNITVRGLAIGINMKSITSNHPFANFQNTDFKEQQLITLVNQLLEDVIDTKHEINKKNNP